jgi:hypothetical protein
VPYYGDESLCSCDQGKVADFEVWLLLAQVSTVDIKNSTQGVKRGYGGGRISQPTAIFLEKLPSARGAIGVFCYFSRECG